MPTALIVEDEPEAHRLLAMLLKIRGYHTLSAFNGAEALVLAGAERPDVILLDLMLPDFNGRDICQTLKSRQETAGIPVVIVSAALAAENRTRCFVLGADDFVPKPYTPDEIFRAVDDTRRRASRISQRLAEGSLDVVSGDLDSAYRELARFLNLLRAETRLEPDALDRIGAFLRSCFVHVEAKTLGQGLSRLATLRHRTFPDRVEFQWTDHRGVPWPDEMGGPADLVFQETVVDQEHRTVTWTARIPEGA